MVRSTSSAGMYRGKGRQPPLRHRRHGLDQSRRDTAFRHQEPQIHAHRACQRPGVALRPGLHTVEQHSPDQCRVVGRRIVSKIRQRLCDQSDILAYGPRADRTMAFKPVGESLEARGQGLLVRVLFERFDPPDRDEMLQKAAQFALVRGCGTPRFVTVKHPGDRADDLPAPETRNYLRRQIAQAKP